MSTEDPITLGELSRRLTGMERRFEGEFAKLGDTIKGLQVVHISQYIAERDAMERRVEELENSIQWLVRAVIGSILFPLIVGVIAAVVIGGRT